MEKKENMSELDKANDSDFARLAEERIQLLEERAKLLKVSNNANNAQKLDKIAEKLTNNKSRLIANLENNNPERKAAKEEFLKQEFKEDRFDEANLKFELLLIERKKLMERLKNPTNIEERDSIITNLTFNKTQLVNHINKKLTKDADKIKAFQTLKETFPTNPKDPFEAKKPTPEDDFYFLVEERKNLLEKLARPENYNQRYVIEQDLFLNKESLKRNLDTEKLKKAVLDEEEKIQEEDKKYKEQFVQNEEGITSNYQSLALVQMYNNITTMQDNVAKNKKIIDETEKREALLKQAFGENPYEIKTPEPLPHLQYELAKEEDNPEKNLKKIEAIKNQIAQINIEKNLKEHSKLKNLGVTLKPEEKKGILAKIVSFFKNLIFPKKETEKTNIQPEKVKNKNPQNQALESTSKTLESNLTKKLNRVTEQKTNSLETGISLSTNTPNTPGYKQSIKKSQPVNITNEEPANTKNSEQNSGRKNTINKKQT